MNPICPECGEAILQLKRRGRRFTKITRGKKGEPRVHVTVGRGRNRTLICPKCGYEKRIGGVGDIILRT